MSRPAHSAIYRFTKTGARAAFVLVMSENDYNAVTRDVVVVPIFADQDTAASDAVVRISPTHIAHCTRITTVLQDDLDLSAGGVRCPPLPLEAVKRGVRCYLTLERLIDQEPSPTVTTSRMTWWPRQADVRYAPLEAAGGDKKMFAFVSDDDWSSRPGLTYSTGAKLTSKSRSAEHWRAALEVTVSGGVAAAGHLYLLPHAVIDERAPNPPRPSMLDAPQMAQLAEKTASVLCL